MFGKILRAGKGGHGLKYKIDLQVINLENLPTSIKKCRVVWARSAKLQMTDVKDVRGSGCVLLKSLCIVGVHSVVSSLGSLCFLGIRHFLQAWHHSNKF